MGRMNDTTTSSPNYLSRPCYSNQPKAISMHIPLLSAMYSIMFDTVKVAFTASEGLATHHSFSCQIAPNTCSKTVLNITRMACYQPGSQNKSSGRTPATSLIWPPHCRPDLTYNPDLTWIDLDQDLDGPGLASAIRTIGPLKCQVYGYQCT